VFEVKATSGDTQLGGTDMNLAVFAYLAERFKDETGSDVSEDAMARARLLEAAEIAKMELSTSTTTRINLPFLAAVRGEPKHLDCELSRSTLVRLVHPVIERCRGPVEQALHDANIATRDIDKLVFVGGPTRMPVVREYFEDFFKRQAEKGVDPMECVACGAAIQAGVLTGQMGDIVLVDVTPLTLGVETLGGVATSLLARNTPIPVKRSEIFTTAADMQTAVTVHVFQGERPFAADNTSLGEFNLDGLVPAPRGVPKIEVTFDIDANGILDVTAKDMATNKSQSIRISGSTRLSRDEKERMVKVAEQYAEQDKKRHDEVDKLNNADSLCYQAEKTLADYGDKIADEVKKRITTAISDTKEAIKQKDATLATERADTLKEALQEVGKKLYEQAATNVPQARPNVGEPTGEPRPSGSGPRGRVVDAEFKAEK
jgi:molecular chaperone DnaK